MALALALLLLPGDAAAQGLTGRVLDGVTGVPVSGALVVASGAGGELGPRTLTGSNGAFTLRWSSSFSLSELHVERIGYGSQQIRSTGIPPGGPVILRIDSTPIELEGIGVLAENLCGDEFVNSEVVHSVWLEARKALEFTALAESGQISSFVTERVERSLDPRNLREVGRTVVPRLLRGERGYRSISGQEMTERGWAETADDGSVVFYAPDAAALLSAEFSAQHCFGAEFEDDRILLSFSPHRSRRSIPEIQGELILDRETYELSELRFEYTSLPLPGVVGAHARGQVSFTTSPQGLWLVREWWIRMPVLARVQQRWQGRTLERIEVTEIREEGGRVLSIETGGEVIQLAAPGEDR